MMEKEPNKNGTNTDKDPLTGKFLPGNPGGPGKPKGMRHMSTLLEEAIRKVAEGDADAADKQIVNKLIEKAKTGEFKHIELIWDRLEGKAPQKIDLGNDETDAIAEEVRELSEKFNEFIKKQ